MVDKRDASCLPGTRSRRQKHITSSAILQEAPKSAETKDAKKIAEEEDIPTRTCEKWLRDLVESSDLEKIKRGLYRKAHRY